MSEQFESGLRDLYAAAETEHDARPGLAIGAMVARTRRTRRTRAAAVTLATAAAVVGVAVAGTAVVDTLGGRPAPPADGPTSPIVGTVTEPVCGTALDDLAQLPEEGGWALRMGLDATELVAGELTGWLGAVVDGLHSDVQAVPGAGIPEGYAFLVAQDGVVVGTSERSLRPADPVDGDPRSHDARIWPIACDGGPLAPGAYDLVAFLPVDVRTDPTGQTTARAVLVSDPVAFTVPDAGPLPDPQAHYLPDGASAVPPTDATVPLPDGNYLALVSDIDAAAGTVTADVVVLYFGSAAQEWVAANAPGTEILDGYVSDDPDGRVDRVIPLGSDVPVWEVCWGPNEEKARRTGGVAEWAVAPREDGESLCSDTSTIPVGGLYWLDVRGGVIAQVVSQFVP